MATNHDTGYDPIFDGQRAPTPEAASPLAADKVVADMADTAVEAALHTSAVTDATYEGTGAVVINAAKRARQINTYYSQLGEGLLEYVGPLVEIAPQEKPLSVALREISGSLLTDDPGKGKV